MSKAQATDRAETVLQLALSTSKDSGTYDLPNNFGDIIFGDVKAESDSVEKFAEEIRLKIPYLKSEGITEEDIRFFWNLNELERRMAEVDDLQSRVTSYLYLIEEKGKNPEEAAAEVRKGFPIYGDSNSEHQLPGDDKFLPWELKDRVNRYIEKQSSDISSYKEKLESSSSLNALIREEIRAGNV